MLQARENLTLSCTGMNNVDATQPLTIIWMFTALDGRNTQTMFNVSSTEVTEMRLSDDITVTSVFTVIGVTSDDGGQYFCIVFNRNESLSTTGDNASATVIVFCKHYACVNSRSKKKNSDISVPFCPI